MITLITLITYNHTNMAINNGAMDVLVASRAVKFPIAPWRKPRSKPSDMEPLTRRLLVNLG